MTWTPLPATAELLVWQDVLAMERMNMLTQHNHEKIQIRQELLAKMAQQPVAAVPPAVGPPTPSVPTIAPAVPSPPTLQWLLACKVIRFGSLLDLVTQ